jgi:NarL family two-component system sensor histidine kinase LiaS
VNALARRFATLRWWLMLSYIVAAFTAMMSLLGAFVVLPGVIAMNTPHRPAVMAQELKKLAPYIAPDLRVAPPNRAHILEALKAYEEPIKVTEGLTDNIHGSVTITPGSNAALFVMNAKGQILLEQAPTAGSASDLARLQQTPEARAVVAAALRNEAQTGDLVRSASNGQTVAAAPIVDTHGFVLGALLIGADLGQLLRPLYVANLLALAPAVVLFGFIASIFGAIFGLLTARGLTRRLHRLTTAAGAWSQGDFAMSARDLSNDELGQLARDLNRMAERLQNLLRDQQRLAVVEERNRFARELHDSVKQQLFALTMLVGSAQLELDDESEAKRILAQAQRIATSAQQEMSALIHAMRPVGLANRDLRMALRELCHEWEERHGIACALDMSDPLALERETEQEIFRVAQEALANIAKHSGATHVEIHAEDDHGALALRIRDNGHGFDIAEADERGMGLSSMRERLARLGGTLHISSSVGGTTIEAHAPLTQRESETFETTDSRSVKFRR